MKTLVTKFSGSGIEKSFRDGDNNTATFNGVTSCIVDQEGNIYAGEVGGAIRRIDQTGHVETVTSTTTALPYGLVLNGGDSLIFNTWNSYMYRVQLPSGLHTTIIGNITSTAYEGPASSVHLYRPSGLTFDELGNLYLMQRELHSIWKLNKTNYVSQFTGPPPPISGQWGLKNGVGLETKFNTPRSLVFDSKGRIFVTDQANQAVRMIKW